MSIDKDLGYNELGDDGLRDNELRDALRGWAGNAPSGVDLLDGVYARTRQLTRRRVAALVTAVAVLVILIPLVVLRPQHGGPQPLPPASPAASTTAPGGVSATLAPAQIVLPDFPLKVGWLPPQVHAKVGLSGTEPQLGDRQSGLVVAVDTADHYTWSWTATSTSAVPINGQDGTLRTSASDNKQVLVGVTWRLPDGRWVMVDSTGNLSQAQVLRIARSVTTGVTPATPLPFILRYAPSGFVLADVEPEGLCLRPPQWAAESGVRNGGLCVWVEPSDAEVGSKPGDTAVTLGGHAGKLRRVSADVVFWSPLPDGRWLIIGTQPGPGTRVADTYQEIPGWIDLSDADLDQFVGGVTITS